MRGATPEKPHLPNAFRKGEPPKFKREDYAFRLDRFREVISALNVGEPKVDAFASPTNARCPIFWAREEEAFGKKPIPERGGGSIPIVALFERELGLKSILMGFGLDEDDIHSPNEHYGIFNYYKGIETIPKFFKFFAAS